MPIDREMWKRGFTAEAVPPWPCPQCRAGSLIVAKNENRSGIVAEHDRASEVELKRSNWSPYNFSGVFAAVLQCTWCRAPVSVCGTLSVETVEEEDNYGTPYQYYSPRLFVPSLHLFKLPAECPESISSEVVRAFNLFWCDIPSCLNHIRQAIEQFLSELRIPRIHIAKGKRRLLTLSDRISKIPAKYNALSNALHAVRWLGNAGSHPGSVSKDDAFDGFDLLEHVLTERYEPNHLHITNMAKAIVKRKGPRTKKRN